jgi:hypothetical protein
VVALGVEARVVGAPAATKAARMEESLAVLVAAVGPAVAWASEATAGAPRAAAERAAAALAAVATAAAMWG